MRALRHIFPAKALQASMVVAILLCACSLDDPRDQCCLDAGAMRYTYRPYGKEAFTQYIYSLRHLLFDADGAYLCEYPPGEELQYQPLDLPEGRYTMVTIGNHGAATALNHAEAPHISALSLACTDHEGDELYWGVCHFAIDAHGRAHDLGARAAALSTLTTPMNNIHCHLTVHVEWANMPPHIGDYAMHLEGVPTAYDLHPGHAANAGGFVVPLHTATGTHRKQVPLDGLTLDATFTTLRYTDEAIPTLRLYAADRQVGPEIDLGRAFRAWGWHPSQIHVQDYKVNIRLYGDGSAELTPLIEGEVSDWIDGGTFS